MFIWIFQIASLLPAVLEHAEPIPCAARAANKNGIPRLNAKTKIHTSIDMMPK